MAATSITIDELRTRLDILEVVGQYVRLQKAGHEYRGICPFHDEKTPSFFVNADKGVWFCRGACGIGGDVFKFVMQAEKLEFMEAAELLAGKLGLTLASKGRPSETKQRERVIELCQRVAEVYQRSLLTAPGGEVAREYLRGRGLSEEILRRFRLGYAPPGWDNLTRWIEREGYDLRDAELAGLVKARERGPGYYDRFRGRVMFPILDPQGRTVGFGGRVIDPHDEPKYLNSPESPLFAKGRLLYGLPLAIGNLEQGAVVVEGYMDVIALHEAGVTNAVATLGTSLTAEHIKLLRRHTDRVTLCYDADQAGSNATDRAAAAFVSEGVDGRVLCLPAGEDPDDFVRRHGREAFEQRLAEAPDLTDYRLRQALESAEGQADPTAAAQAAVVGILGDITDEVRQAQYVRQVAEWWAGEAVGLQEELERTLIRALRRRRAHGRWSGPEEARPDRESRPAGRAQRVERVLLRLLLQEPALRADALAELSPTDFTAPATRQLFEALAGWGLQPADAGLADGLDDAAQTLLAELLCQSDSDAAPVQAVVLELRCLRLEREADAVRRRRADLAGEDFEAQAELSREWIAIQQRLDETRQALHNVGGKR